jgi:arabinogalactan oligomer/maltooligosaccharide transport system permease protein
VGRRLAALTVAALAAVVARGAAADEMVLWHSYRGLEQAALESLVVQWNEHHPTSPVRVLDVPHDAYPGKITSAIPRGQGPDVFIFAHERIGDWARMGLLADVGDELPGRIQDLEALTVDGAVYGVPLAYKSLALYYNRDMVSAPPDTTDEMVALAERLRDPQRDVFGLAYEAGSFFHHAAWLFGFGGRIFDERGRPVLDDPANGASIAFVRDLTERDLIPSEPNAALVSQLFNDGRAGMVINGPWFMGEIAEDVDWAVCSLPDVSPTGLAATPLLTVEAALVSSRARDHAEAVRFALFLSREGAAQRLEDGMQVVTAERPWTEADVDPALVQFRVQAQRARLTPNNPLMRSVWEPASRALRAVLRGSATPAEALDRAQGQLEAVTREPPPERHPLPYLLGLLLVVIGAAVWCWRRNRGRDLVRDMARARHAYAYVAPTAAALLVLVFVPFVVGTAVAFFSHRGGEFTFVGLANFVDILLSRDHSVTDPLSFYFTLGVTVMWTAVNVALHVSIGLALAMVLRSPWLKLRGVYRVLLIVPWAVPNYITALIWKGMFHGQFGAVNGLLDLMGLQPVSWFSGFWTAFAANVTTNTWLGFPFMMVVCLGALQAIPGDLEEAAEMDGAGAWTRFTRIVLPLIKPALVPAVILGSVWTFNMFNIIYLVSGGEPDGSTEILISEAYRWAFSRQEQYGYAAAYAVLIFVALYFYSRFTRRITEGLKEAEP